MSDNAIQNRIKKLICDGLVVGVVYDDLKGESSLINDLQLDSIQMIELITKLEGEFSIELDDEDFDFEVFSTIDSLTKFVEEKQNA